jgi:hypothetical protein
MPLVPPIPTVLEPRQTTLLFNGPLIALKKPRKPAQSAHKIPLKLNYRWLLGSAYKNVLIRQFGTARTVNYDPNESNLEGIALYQHSYSYELKLAAIEWALNTYKKGKKDGDLDKLITRYRAAKKLRITITML